MQRNWNRRKTMAWELDADKPIYAQLTERLQTRIILGQYRPGEKLPSVCPLCGSWRRMHP